jgi:PD-(D/E)XK nuclease family transposase
MMFADLKNDFVFRRIFATHPDILRGLLNDLLDRHDETTIVGLEYLPSEQLPLAKGSKLSILDVRCKDRAGTTFIVEMQLIHHQGFVNRVVCNACKAYAGQLKEGDPYTKLADVVAVSICDFNLWPDDQQETQGLPRVPMLSRWNMTERSSKNHGLLQVQYAFLELPKVPPQRPEKPGADLWAWLFVHAPELTEMPADFSPGPFRDALELAVQAKFSPTELEAYQKVRDEIRQVLEMIAEGRVEGEIRGEIKGEIKGKRGTLLRLLARAGITLTEDERARIAACTDAETLDRWSENVLGAKTGAAVLS